MGGPGSGSGPRKISNECLDAFLGENFRVTEIARACGLSKQAIHARTGKGLFNLHAARSEYYLYWRRVQGNRKGNYVCQLYPELKLSVRRRAKHK